MNRCQLVMRWETQSASLLTSAPSAFVLAVLWPAWLLTRDLVIPEPGWLALIPWLCLPLPFIAGFFGLLFSFQSCLRVPLRLLLVAINCGSLVFGSWVVISVWKWLASLNGLAG